MIRALVVVLLSVAVMGCPNTPETLCASLARRCGGEARAAWEAWCNSECVPTYASHTPCAANDACMLCDEPDASGRVAYFGLPGNDLEYLWTFADEEVEPTYPSLPEPTGSSFDDRADSWNLTASSVGAWSILQPYDVTFGQASGFCEPGPNQYLGSNIASFADSVVLRAERLNASQAAQSCSYDTCPSGPYPACGTSFATECPYGDAPEVGGMGSAAQIDRGASGALQTYGFGRYRVEEMPSSEVVDSQSGFVYAFFTQGNLYCEGSTANTSSNTGEIDVEITRGFGRLLGRDFCNADQLCVQFVNWASSTQGIPGGRDRHHASAFRFRDLEVGRRYRTFGFDWTPNDVRFVYDTNPSDCDERAGGCPPAEAPVAVCRHARFVPQRPSELHVQLWGAHWAGEGRSGSRAEMSVQRVWHEPFSR